MQTDAGWHELGDADDEDGGQMFAEMEGWLILSHIAASEGVANFEVQGEGGNDCGHDLLGRIGGSPVVLRWPSASEALGIACHDLDDGSSVVCSKIGIVEPITYSLFRYLMAEGSRANPWIARSVSHGSQPLLARLSIALSAISCDADQQLSEWATAKKSEVDTVFVHRHP